jgi:dihydrofolate synthase / folylpolyglutamate synthase
LVARRLPADSVFFSEWEALRRVTRRSVARTAMLADALGINVRALPSVVVVGSKGKATTATFASAVLAAAGLRVGTITSPPIITNRERIRIDGAAIDDAEYESIAEVTRAALAGLPSPTPATGYISPAGMYMVAGLRHQQRNGCEVFVVEAAMGGRSDEVSLLAPAVLAVTPIFDEHVGTLGATVAEIAEEKLGAVSPITRNVVSAPQCPEVDDVFRRLRIARQIIDRSPIDGSALLVQPMSTNVSVGLAAGLAFLPPDRHPAPERLLEVLSTIRLPGRLTVTSDAAGRRWIVDAAVNAVGIAAALRHAFALNGNVDFVLVSLPDNKDVERTATYLDGIVGPAKWTPVIPPDAEHLPYSDAAWRRSLLRWCEADDKIRTARSIVAVGSWSFMSAVLGRLGADAERSFRP